MNLNLLDLPDLDGELGGPVRFRIGLARFQTGPPSAAVPKVTPPAGRISNRSGVALKPDRTSCGSERDLPTRPAPEGFATRPVRFVIGLGYLAAVHFRTEPGRTHFKPTPARETGPVRFQTRPPPLSALARGGLRPLDLPRNRLPAGFQTRPVPFRSTRPVPFRTHPRPLLRSVPFQTGLDQFEIRQRCLGGKARGKGE